jgi:hypothetical protein
VAEGRFGDALAAFDKVGAITALAPKHNVGFAIAVRQPLDSSAQWSILNAQRSRHDVPFKNPDPSGARSRG